MRKLPFPLLLIPFFAHAVLAQDDPARARMPDVRVRAPFGEFPDLPPPDGSEAPSPRPPGMRVPGLPPPELLDVYREALPREAEAAKRADRAQRLIRHHRPEPILDAPILALLLGLLVMLALGIAALAGFSRKRGF